MERQDPPSTRFTYIMSVDDVELYDTATPGDRIEMHEEREEQATGRVLTARVLDVRRIRVG